MSGPVSPITSLADFDALLSANRLVLADFYADWCGPCRAVAPLYGKLAEANAQPGRLAFAKVNVDAAQDVARRYCVSAMPTFLFFAEGERTALPVPGVAGGGAQVNTEGAVAAIRGADARALTAVANALGELARKSAPEGEQKVSGGSSSMAGGR
jgi:thioredoxin 1